MPSLDSEDALVEQPAIEVFEDLGWTTKRCYDEEFGAEGTLGRETPSEVILTRHLRTALERLNPGASTEALTLAIDELTRDRSRMAPAAANRECYELLKNGVRVAELDDSGDEQEVELIRVIDWTTPENNDFFLASQLWVTGEMYKRRPDLVGFVNGIPLVLLELKASHKSLENAYTDNLRDYKTTIPQLFWPNGLIILSNGSESRVGTLTSEWAHFAEWKKINSEGEEGIVSLDTMLRGMCEKTRLLDLIENFTVYEDTTGGTLKILAKNHQYHGVNNAIDALQDIQANQGRLGVFWHTQGSGKSFSMLFFSQKVLRKRPGNYTFVVVTDRQELDNQIHRTFKRCGAATGREAQAQSAAGLRQLLQEDHRYVFTLIQKFRTEAGELHPMLSDRSDIIVMTDEAHRSQYDVFALNMRNALPNAAFIGFTGTPLMVGEEKTKEVFGDYVSIYNFSQAVEDNATVPLYYENRIPELQLTNEHLNEDMERLLEAAELDEAQEEKLEREFAREYHLITRDDRLDKVAEDIVRHFMGRGYVGKAMVVCIDKATAVLMYDKVRAHWQRHRDELAQQIPDATIAEKPVLEQQVSYMDGTDMAVVVSQSQNEIADFRNKGLDIEPHRRRMVSESLDEKFKDSNDPFRLVFVCAMWMTGFDAPACSTIYLDKPMRNHTLMQTIARANRVFREKVDGLIVDYVGVFRNLQKAFAIYGAPGAGGDTPILDKEQLVERLREALAQASTFCVEVGVDIPTVRDARGFERVKLIDDVADAVLVNDDAKRRFITLARTVDRLFKAILPTWLSTHPIFVWSPSLS